ncbi:hypothetical protein, partial [Salmonella sp. E393-2]|uniref:hypothetical protein n=1 Tax=Salmonella sp. E393-2 TaxID=3240324 RepID=UPI00352A019D
MGQNPPQCYSPRPFDPSGMRAFATGQGVQHGRVASQGVLMSTDSAYAVELKGLTFKRGSRAIFDNID